MVKLTQPAKPVTERAIEVANPEPPRVPAPVAYKHRDALKRRGYVRDDMRKKRHG